MATGTLRTRSIRERPKPVEATMPLEPSEKEGGPVIGQRQLSHRSSNMYGNSQVFIVGWIQKIIQILLANLCIEIGHFYRFPLWQVDSWLNWFSSDLWDWAIAMGWAGTGCPGDINNTCVGSTTNGAILAREIVWSQWIIMPTNVSLWKVICNNNNEHKNNSNNNDSSNRNIVMIIACPCLLLSLSTEVLYSQGWPSVTHLRMSLWIGQLGIVYDWEL